MGEATSVTITLTPNLEQAVVQRARERRTTPEAVILDALREKLSRPESEHQSPAPSADEWKIRLRKLATRCGVSLSNEAVSTEGLYD